MHDRHEPANAEGAERTDDSNTPSDTLPPRRRRRVASRPAGPPTSVAEPVTAEVTEATPPAPEAAREAPPAPEPAEEPAPPRRRRRATRATSEPRPAESAETADEPTEPTESPEAAQAPAAEEATPEVAELADVPEVTEVAPRRRRRAVRAAAEPDPEAPVRRRRAAKSELKAVEAEPEPVAETPEEPAVETTDEPVETTPRRRRRASRAAAELAAPPEPAAAPEPAEERETGRRRKRPGRAEAEQRPKAGAPQPEEELPQPPAAPAAPAVVFQAPVFQAPMFQTPQRAAEEAATRYAEAPESEVDDELDEADENDALTAEAPEDTAPVAVPDEDEAADDDNGRDRPARRRRRGGRRRRRGELAERAAEAAAGEAGPDEAAGAADERQDEEPEAEPSSDGDDQEQAEENGGGSSRRRRRRRRRTGDAGEQPNGEDDPERTVVKVREPRRKREEGVESSDGVRSIKGSTRLEAKKQRRREGREQGRRRVPIITEAEFLARRESVERVMVVRQHGERTQIGVLEDNVLVEHFVNKEQSSSYVGNVYLGKVQNVLPSMEAAFVDIGKGRNAVLYAGEVNFEALGLGHGPRRIETALKSGQPVLVQVTKDPIGHKGARLTSQISLPGRYLVYVPEGSMTGISRKLPDTERSRLKQILKKIVPDDAGVIVRTAAEGATEEELTRDVERLQAQWAEIQKKSKKGNAPTLLYGEPDMTVRVVRDIFNEDFSKVIVSGDTAWETIHGYVSHVAPDLAERLQRWTSEVDVFATYRIDEQLMKALDRKVWLPSGGSLVIDRTEAMVVIDVNTGRFTGQGGNLEETVTRNNLEAAEEIVRQLRLRDLGGIIVMDFIDMVLESNRDLVLRRLLECLGRDRTKHQVAEVTSLGLVQMTRKRVGQGLLESFSEPCVHCNGRGVIVHMEHAHAPAGGGGGGGKKGRKRGKGAAAVEAAAVEHATEQVPEPVGASEEPEPVASVDPVEPIVPAETAQAVERDEPLDPVEPAEPAEPTAGRRQRRRATRKASAPAGPPKVADEGVVTTVTEPEPVAEPVVEPEPVVAEEPAAKPARRRGSRKVSVPAGAPRTTSEPTVLVVSHEQPEPAAEPEPAPAAAPEPAAPRRAARRASAPAGSPEGAEEAVITVVAAEPAEEPAEAAEPEAPARKTAKRATTKKTVAKKAAGTAKKTTTSAPAKKAAKSAPAKKTAAKKATAKKATAKRATTKKTEAKKATTAKKSTTGAAGSASTEE
ncbi:ribonuclease E/G [Streptomyces profundus]|uniref:ribonuclease E/G n=1 Tax=Streptomyces profundus TaxID=2867410 RepID=UPI001D16DA48|nr:ribonuclease E/G [Streptomyces sp. MA3_2.13]UED86462.1 Rne/Rng family ribonuclease [Streptomyces sp. MA3_2.13]